VAACSHKPSLELALLVGGAWIYARAVPVTSVRGHIVLWGFVALLAALQVYANFGPPPVSDSAMANMALGFYPVPHGDYGDRGTRATGGLSGPQRACDLNAKSRRG